MPSIKKIKVVERKLRRYYGYAYPEIDLIELREGMGDRLHLGTLTHEIIHILKPDWSEHAVDTFARNLTHYLWKAGYRKSGENKLDSGGGAG